MDQSQSSAWSTLVNSLISFGGTLLAFFAFFFFASLISRFINRFSWMKRKLNFAILPDAEGKRRLLPRSSPALLQINLRGMIGIDDLTAEAFETQLLESQMGELRDERVRGILLYIDSPGGAAKDTDTIYRRLKAYKEKYKIPLFAYVDGYCASGGIFAACAADRIIASPSCIIGSIGVRVATPFLNVYKLLQKWEIGVRTFAEGKHKDHLNPFRPWQEGEDSDLKNVLAQTYSRFVDIVASSRKIPRDKLVHEIGAQIYASKEALSLGLIDVADSDYSLALSALAEAAKINEPYQVVELIPKKNWFREMMNNSLLFKGKIKHELSIGPHSALIGQIAYLYSPGI